MVKRWHYVNLNKLFGGRPIVWFKERGGVRKEAKNKVIKKVNARPVSSVTGLNDPGSLNE